MPSVQRGSELRASNRSPSGYGRRVLIGLPLHWERSERVIPPHRRDGAYVDRVLVYLDLIEKLVTLRGSARSTRRYGKEERLLHALDRVWSVADETERRQIDEDLHDRYAGRFDE